MRDEERHWDQQVLALVAPRDDGAVVDRVGAARVDLDVALVARVAVGVDVALHVVAVHVVGAHADRPRGGEVTTEVALGLDPVGDHAARFAHVDLVRPVVVVGELNCGEAPTA